MKLSIHGNLVKYLVTIECISLTLFPNNDLRSILYVLHAFLEILCIKFL